MPSKRSYHLDLIGEMAIDELLIAHVEIEEELRKRGVLRSANNPTGDLAEHLFCTGLGWKRASSSEPGFDATGSDGTRYQIKGRRLNRRNPSRQLSAIRNLDNRPFDVLAAVLFDHYYRVVRAALIPVEVVAKRATYQRHTNSHIFHLRDDVWDTRGVTDVTGEISPAPLQA